MSLFAIIACLKCDFAQRMMSILDTLFYACRKYSIIPKLNCKFFILAIIIWNSMKRINLLFDDCTISVFLKKVNSEVLFSFFTSNHFQSRNSNIKLAIFKNNLGEPKRRIFFSILTL